MILTEPKSSFIPAPEGLHQAVCVDFVDLGVMDTPWGKKAKCRVVWQIEETMDNGERFLVSNMYTASLSEKGALRPVLEAWRGRKFTPEELEGFDTEKLIGANCQLQIVHVESKKTKGNFFANVQAIVPIGKQTPKMVSEGYVRQKDREDNHPAEPSSDDEVPF